MLATTGFYKLYKKPKENHKKLLRIFTPFLYFLIGCKKASRTFRTNHSVVSSLHQQKELSRNSKANILFGYSELLSSAPDRKTETDQNGKKKIQHSYASSTRSVCCIWACLKNCQHLIQKFFILSPFQKLVFLVSIYPEFF